MQRRSLYDREPAVRKKHTSGGGGELACYRKANGVGALPSARPTSAMLPRERTANDTFLTVARYKPPIFDKQPGSRQTRRSEPKKRAFAAAKQNFATAIAAMEQAKNNHTCMLIPKSSAYCAPVAAQNYSHKRDTECDVPPESPLWDPPIAFLISIVGNELYLNTPRAYSPRHVRMLRHMNHRVNRILPKPPPPRPPTPPTPPPRTQRA